MEDRIVRTNIIHRDMSMKLANGNIIPLKGQVIENIWQSGRKDCKVKLDKPLDLLVKPEEMNNRGA